MSTLLSAVRRLPRDVRTPASIHVISIPQTVAILSALISGSATGAVHTDSRVTRGIGLRRNGLVGVITGSMCKEGMVINE